MVSRHAPSGPRFLHIMTVSPVKRVGASVSFPHSSALAGDEPPIRKGRVTMAKERAAPQIARETTVSEVAWGAISTAWSSASTCVLVGVGGIEANNDDDDDALTDVDETGEKAVTLLLPPLPMKTTNSKVETLMVMVTLLVL